MATQTLVPVEDYLRRVDEGGCPDYLDGVLVERNVGHYKHSKIQVLLVAAFLELGKRIPCHAAPELHLKLAARRYRVADLAVFFGPEPGPDIPTMPPDLVVEVLSPDDRHKDLIEKLEEYRQWGVTHIWFVDPWTERLHVYNDAGLMQVASFRLPESDFEITPKDLFG